MREEFVLMIFRKRKKLDRNIEISEFNKSLKLIADKDLLQKYIASKIQHVAEAKDVYFYLLNNELNRFFLFGKPLEKREMSFTFNDKLIFWLSSNESYLELKKRVGIFNFFEEKESTLLRELKVELIYPLKVMNQLKGMVFLSGKTDGTDYTSNEKEILTSLLDQASFALENVSLHQQQRDRISNMYRADRLSIMGELAAGAAHEIRNPLTSIRSTIQYFMKGFDNTDQKELAAGLIEEVDRINEILQGLLSFARPNSPKPENIDVELLINQVIQLLNSTAKKKNILIDFQYHAEGKYILADPGQLKQVFINIIINGIQAISGEGIVRIAVEEKDNHHEKDSVNAKDLFIIISDSGCGIPDKKLDQIFDPFYTTREDGTGLGLSISYGIINKHGGDIKIESEEGRGTVVTISIPYVN
ncbi:MAG: two-component system sensor histidine kinase NtrB [Draconibacterium sp.]